ncbi:hypothetical protein FB45DRAFT_919164 [Roridomyces roridus]|uniref:Uncharacterized protein n=1 Tax=Roridomyces roridus TaxID=1738132 RepID=A0AAD7FMI9_9AGAR|nr:hypothetical protein FB45DRAFT_919164 [Roridomyces roridus]
MLFPGTRSVRRLLGYLPTRQRGKTSGTSDTNQEESSNTNPGQSDINTGELLLCGTQDALATAYHNLHDTTFKCPCAVLAAQLVQHSRNLPFDLIGSCTSHKMFFIVAALVSTALAQCSLSGYLGAFDSTTGAFVGAVGRTLENSGIFTLDVTGNTANYLGVMGTTNSTSSGDAIVLQIISPVNPTVPFVALVSTTTDCFNVPNPIDNGDAPWVAFVTPSDGSPRGPFPLPADTRTTFPVGYSQLATFCGEPMAWTTRSDFGLEILVPIWTDQNGNQHSLIVMYDVGQNILGVSPTVASYEAANNNSPCEEVVFSIIH